MNYHKLDAALIAAMGSAADVDAAAEAGGAKGVGGARDVGGAKDIGGAEDIGGARDVDDAGTIGLAGSRQARTFAVFIHTTHPLHADEARYLLNLGVRGAAPRRRILTATVSAPVIATLSEMAWVRALRLSQTRTLTPPVNPTASQPDQPNQRD
jgi:hypothetical protein